MTSLVLSLILSLGFTAQAKEHLGVKFDDEVKIGTQTLKLNGTGTRKAMGFVTVYVAALYTAELTTDEEKIISSTTPKKLTLHFKRWVEKGKIIEAWEEGFAKNHGEYNFKEDFKKLKAVMSHIGENERINMTFYSDKAEIQIKNDPAQTIEGADFSKTLLKVFIGKAPDPDLKKGLLGK